MTDRAHTRPPPARALAATDPAGASPEASALAFVRASTVPMPAGVVPEITLHLARDSHAIFQAAEGFARPEPRLPPYWAFAWPAGQALARHLLDRPRLVAGKRVLDIGAGSGLAAIAALKAGARSALAADIDAVALAACRLNAGLNAVALETTAQDLLAGPPDADLVLLGDIFYEPELALRVGAFLARAARTGAAILFADRTTTRHPPAHLEMLAEYVAPLLPMLQDGHIEKARVWKVLPR